MCTYMCYSTTTFISKAVYHDHVPPPFRTLRRGVVVQRDGVYAV